MDIIWNLLRIIFGLVLTLIFPVVGFVYFSLWIVAWISGMVDREKKKAAEKETGIGKEAEKANCL